MRWWAGGEDPPLYRFSHCRSQRIPASIILDGDLSAPDLSLSATLGVECRYKCSMLKYFMSAHIEHSLPKLEPGPQPVDSIPLENPQIVSCTIIPSQHTGSQRTSTSAKS